MIEKRYDIVNETCNRLIQLLCLVGVKLEYFKYFIKDTKENKYLTISDTIDLLNELNDERMMYKTTIDKRIVELEEENEQLKIANAKWFDKSLQERQIRYSNANHKELTKKYLQLEEENEQLRQILKNIVGATDETYTKNKNIYKVTVVFDGEMYNQIRRCLNE